MTVSNDILKRAADAYRRIRNTARFLLANLNGFDPAKDQVEPEQLVELDKWIIDRTKAMQTQIVAAYDQYDMLGVSQGLMQFCSVDLGSFYLDIIKDRQYTAKTDGLARRSCQTAMYHIAESLVRWMAPIMSFTAQEIWQVMPGQRGDYVFTETWYDGLDELAISRALDNSYWEKLMQVKAAVNASLEQARNDKTIGGSLEAAITLYADGEMATLLKTLEDELRFVLITSDVEVIDYANKPSDVSDTELAGLAVDVKKAKGTKCVRCWHHKEEVGSIDSHPELCARCVSNVDGAGESRRYA